MEENYKAQTLKVGNSLYVIIPKHVKKYAQIAEGDLVNVKISRIAETINVVMGVLTPELSCDYDYSYVKRSGALA